MKTKIASIGAIVAVSVAAAATAKTNTLSGTFPEDSAGAIQLSVVIKNKKPKKVKDVSASYTYRCVDSEDNLTSSTITGPVPGTFKIQKDSQGRYRWSGETADGDRTLNFNGKVDKKGKHATGSLGVEGGDPDTGSTCGNLSTNWNADK